MWNLSNMSLISSLYYPTTLIQTHTIWAKKGMREPLALAPRGFVFVPFGVTILVFKLGLYMVISDIVYMLSLFLIKSILYIYDIYHTK